MKKIVYTGGIYGDEFVKYIFDREIRVESLKAIWKRMSHLTVQHDGFKEYINVADEKMRVFDSKNEAFVRCKQIIRSPMEANPWYQITFDDDSTIIVTGKTRFPVKGKSLSRYEKKYIDELFAGEVLVGVDYGAAADSKDKFKNVSNEEDDIEYIITDLFEKKIVRVTKINKASNESFQLVTDTGLFDVSGTLILDAKMR